jgi:MFS family permease
LFNAAISVSFEGAYNTYYPIILQGGHPAFGAQGGTAYLGFGLSAFMTGIVMSLDNIIGMIFAPIFGAMGDQSLRRRNYSIIASYISAALFSTFPMIAKAITPQTSGQTELLMLPLVLIVTAAIAAAFSSKFSGAYRNGYIFSLVPNQNQGILQSFCVIAGAVGFIVATFFASYLYTLDSAYPFYLGSAILVLATFIFQIFAPDETAKNAMLNEKFAKTGKKFTNPLTTIKEVFNMLPKEARLSMLMIVLVQNLGKFGIIALQTYFSSWMLNKLGLGPNVAASATIVFFVFYLVASFPMGYLVDRVDQTKLYLIAITLTFLAAIGMAFLATNFITICIFSGVFGIALSIFDIVTIPYTMSFVPQGSNSSGTIIAMIVMVLAALSVVIVPLCGFLIDITHDYNTLYYATVVATLLALVPLQKLHSLNRLQESGTSLPHA